jgi:PhnB protein
VANTCSLFDEGRSVSGEQVRPVPEGYPRASPYLCVDCADAAIAFSTDVLGATERMRLGGPDGKLGHAELRIGDSFVMLPDEWPEMDVRGPQSYRGTAVTIGVYVDDVDAVFARAIARGSTAVRPVEHHFSGDRSWQFIDP